MTRLYFNEVSTRDGFQIEPHPGGPSSPVATGTQGTPRATRSVGILARSHTERVTTYSYGGRADSPPSSQHGSAMDTLVYIVPWVLGSVAVGVFVGWFLSIGRREGAARAAMRSPTASGSSSART